jgi:hypothetical protein
LVNWENDGAEMFELATKLYGSPTRTIKNLKYYFRAGISWSMIGSGRFSVRMVRQGFIFDQAADSLFADSGDELLYFLGLLNSRLAEHFLAAINPTLNTTAGVVKAIPVAEHRDGRELTIANMLVCWAKCQAPCDYIPRRSYPLFLARDVLRLLREEARCARQAARTTSK